MAKREILLVQDVLKLGNMGDVVKVAPGYARNFLFPERMAVPLVGAAKRQIEVLRERAAKSETEREQKAVALKKTMEGMTVQIAARVAHELELFGSIGTREICQALAKSGIEVDTKQVHLTDKIKRLGSYPVSVKLHKKVDVEIKIDIVNSDPNAPSIADILAAQAAARAAKQAEAEAKAKAGEGEDSANADSKPADKTEKKDKAEPKSKSAGKSGEASKPSAGAKPAGKGAAKSKKA